jgi:hypothetical protein
MLFVFHHPTGLPSALSLSFLSYRSEKSSLDYYTIKIHDKKNIIQFVETKKKKENVSGCKEKFILGRERSNCLIVVISHFPTNFL